MLGIAIFVWLIGIAVEVFPLFLVKERNHAGTKKDICLPVLFSTD